MADFGQGPLARGAALVYSVIVAELLLLLVTLPALAILIFSGNVLLAALCAVPAGPGLSAAMFAIRHRSRDITDLQPMAAFWRGWRLNARGALLIWVPGLLWLTVLAVDYSATGLAAWWAALLAIVGLMSLLWLANALVITSLFAFRARDVARLAAYFLVRTPLVTVGNAGVFALAAIITIATSEAMLVLSGSLLVLVLLRSSQPMITLVTREFT